MGPNFRYCARNYFDCADHSSRSRTSRSPSTCTRRASGSASVTPRFLPFSFRGRLPTARPLVRAYLGFPPAWRVIGKQFLVVGER